MTQLKRMASAPVKPLPTTQRGTRKACDHDREPTKAELKAIEAEWPLIAAEIAVVDAEIAVFCAPHEPTELDWRRLRRVHDLVRQRATELSSPPAPASLRRIA